MDVYQVSRSTIRQAVAALERSGLVERRRGLGTRVTERPLIDSTARIYSLAGWITGTGLAERSVVPITEATALPDEAAQHLDLAPGDQGIHIMRVRYADDEPIALDRSWFPLHIGESLLTDDLTTGSLYDRLTQVGVIPSGSVEHIHPIDPEPDDRTMLDLPPGEMAFRIKRIVYATKIPIEHRDSIIRGDRFTLTATWGTPSALRYDPQREISAEDASTTPIVEPSDQSPFP
jgi:GntR family transcriptional regulator